MGTLLLFLQLLHEVMHQSIFISLRVDSIMLLENNFKVTSTDASDKMLKQAWKIRWQRRKEEAFDKWGKE